MRDNTIYTLALVGFVAAIVIGLIWYEVAIWNECRDAGHSVMYCIRMVAR